MVRLASEFPNDNPVLHCGVIWVCRATTGPAEPEYPEALVIEELEPLDASVTAEGVLPSFASEPPPPEASGILPIATSALPPAPDDPFTVLACLLADVAIGAGAPHVAALLPGLLYDGRIEGPIDEELARLLRAGGLWDGTTVSPSFVAVTCAWRAILRGTSDDFDACGGTTLDQWAADLLATLLGTKALGLRSELRTRGVAAFGLVDAAA